MRTRWLILSLCLLCLAGAWFFWHQPANTRTRPSALQKVAATTVTTVRSASTAPNILATASTNGATSAKTNQFAYRLSNTTKTIGQLVSDRHAILLENALIDTGAKLNFSIPKNLQSPGDPGAYIVQARGPIDNAFRAMLASAGAEIVSYIPNDAYLVRAPAGVANGLAGNPLTQAVIPYEPYYKISSSMPVTVKQKSSSSVPMKTNRAAGPSLLALAVKQAPLPAGTYLTLGLFNDGAAATVAQIEKLGGQIVARDNSPFGPVVRVQPPADWVALATLPGVQIVEPLRQRVHANDLSRATVGVAADTQVSSNYLGLTGKNVLVEVNDSGIDANHPDFGTGGGPPIRVFGDSALSLVDTNGHGTHVAGIIAGDGTESTTVSNAPGSILATNGFAVAGQFRGMAPLANLLSMDWNASDQELQEAAARTNALISNNSWNNGGDTAYDLAAASYDAAVRDALPEVTGSQPVLFVFSAGNAGNGDDTTDPGSGTPDSIESPATAKNVITVGAIQEFRDITNQVMTIAADGTTNISAPWQPETSTSYRIAGFSSRGNVGIGTEGTYGRYKPDVVAPGTFIVSTRSSQWDITDYFYQSPTNFNVQNFSVIVQADSLGAGEFPLVPANTVQVTIQLFPNATSPVPFPDLPIYFGLLGSPTYPYVTTNNQVSIPPDGGLTIPDILSSEAFYGFNFAISNITSEPINFDIVLDTITTNNPGNYFLVYSNLDQSLGGINLASTGPGPYYRYETGTSMSAADVSGVLALMQDYFTNTLYATPSPALLKAMLINGARATGFYNFHPQNAINYEGWGLINLPNSLPPGITTNVNNATGEAMLVLDQSPASALATGDSHTYHVTVAGAAAALPLRITLAWTDPPGDPAAAIKLVNNLDLIVTNFDDPANPIIFYGNDIASGSIYNTPEGTNAQNLDSINNVENVFISPLLGANYSITVIGRGVNVNAVTAQTNNAAGVYAPNVVQDYALVISCGNGEVTNAFTVTDNPIISNPTTDQDVTFVTTTNAPLLNQLVGASTPLLGTNTIPLGTNLVWGRANSVITLGMTNQWHFYVVTNTTGFTNAAFITFIPNTLSIPRMGVFADSAGNATRPGADIDLYVTTDPTLMNLNPVAISNCVNGAQVGASSGNIFNGASLGRGGTEFVVDTNSSPSIPGEVYYVGVYSEDQEASEYGFIPIFSQHPFSQLNPNGSQSVFGVPLPVDIPDGSPAHPGSGYVFGLALYPMQVQQVVVTDLIAHQNFGDLIGTLTHGGNNGLSGSIVLNNHDSLYNSSGIYTQIYDDSGQGDIIGSQPSDGPGSLNTFTGQQGNGVWLLTEVDDSLTQTGSVTSFQMLIEPHQDPTKGVYGTAGPFGWGPRDYIDVPSGVSSMTVSATNLTPSPSPYESLYVKYGSIPTLTDTNEYGPAGLTNGTPPGNSITISSPAPGRYWYGVYNDSAIAQSNYVIVNFTIGKVPGQVIFSSSGPAPILDDAVMTNSIYVSAAQNLSSVDVGLRVDHPRVSDLVFHLISPDGTRCLLVENRGGTTTNGMGATLAITNIIPVSSHGSASPVTNLVTTASINGTLTVYYDFQSLADEMVVFDQGGNLIFDSGFISFSGVFNIAYTNSSVLTIVMNPNGNPQPGTIWDYTVNSSQAYYTYLVLTEDTNKTTTPIKYAVPPFHGTPTLTPVTNVVVTTIMVPVTNAVVVTNTWVVTNTAYTTNMVPAAAEWHSGFESTNTISFSPTAGQYFPEGWHVDSGSVDLAINGTWFGNKADEGNWMMDLDGVDAGTISTNIPTVPGQNYVLSLAYSRNADSVGLTIPSANVLINNNPVGTLVANFNDTWASLNWHSTSYVFTATSSSTLLTFHSLDAGKPWPDVAYGVLLDAINLSSGLNDGFEKTVAGDYVQGVNPVFGGWSVTANQVTVISNATLADGVISRLLPTVPGQTYTLSYAYREAPPLQGLVSWWPGENNANDIMGLNNGILQGGLGFAPGEVGQAFNFDGIAGTVSVPASPSLNVGTGQGFTLECWTAPTSVTNQEPLMEWRGNGGSIHNGAHFWISGVFGGVGGPGCIYANIVDSVGGLHIFASPTGIVQAGILQHVALTYDKASGVGKIYYNGSLVASSNLGSFTPKTDTALLLGRRMDFGNFYYQGVIDESAIFNRALSSNEIQAIYNAGHAGKCGLATPPSVCAEAAQAVLNGISTNIVVGTTNWQTTNITFTATQTNTPLQITGIEPGMLLDSFVLTNFVVMTNFTYVTNTTYWTNYGANGFEGAAAGDYTQSGSFFDGWAENTNQVTVITDTNLAYQGSNLLALADGQISRILPTVPGQTYTLSYAYRGPGIVSLWRGENNGNDSISNNPGTPSSMTYASGVVGTAFVFDGVSSQVRVPASASLDVGINNSGYTIDAWVNPVGATINNLQSLLEWNVGSGSGAAPIAAQFGFSGNYDGDLYANIMDTTLTAHSLSSAVGTMTGNIFQHVAVTFDKATGLAVLYKNGVVVQSLDLGTGFTPWTSVDFFLGVRPAGNFANHFNGMMDEPGIYNRPLSASEIKAIFNHGIMGKYDLAAPSIAQGLAEAQVTVGGTNLLFFGNNTNWQTTNITFTAALSNTVLQITGIEPGMLLDNFALSQLVFVTNNVVTTNVISGSGDVYYLPEQSLDTYKGLNALGQWQLEIWDNRVGAGLTNTLVSWQLRFNFATNFNSIGVLTNGLAVTNVIPPGGMAYYLVIVPPNADFATNRLLFATGPLNVWFNQTTLPAGTNPPDYLLIPNSTGGSSILSLISAPTNFAAGGTYYLGVQNTGTSNITYGIEVDFHLLFPPVLPSIGTQIIDELTLMTVTNTASSANPPLTYSVSGPPGVAISTNGIITWTPTEAQGPGFYFIQTTVTDSSVPPLHSTNSFNVIVIEVNTPPFFLGTPADQTINAFYTLIVTNAAGDSDIPTNPLTYTLLNPPAGMTIDTNGAITWTPTLAQALTTNLIATVVTDFNAWAPVNQILSATNYFTVFVTGALSPFAFTQPATSVTGTSAQLNGMATPNGPPTTAWFEWGTSATYGNQTPPVSVGGSFNVVYVPSQINGLVMNQPYHFRLVVSNVLGVVYGFDQIFDETGVVAWGADYLGQTDVPSGLSNVVAVAAAHDHSLALKNDGTVLAWGDGFHGQTNVPAGLNGVVAVAGGEFYSLVLKNNGTVAAWGANTVPGQTNVPAGLNSVVTIAGGRWSSLALKSNGRVVAWGYNIAGLTNVPAGLSNVVAVAGGGFHSLAVKNDGTVLVWGDNSAGQKNVPPGLSNVVAIAGGGFHSLALKYDGTVVAWGDDSDGQTDVPPGLNNVVAVAAGGFHSLVLKNDGSVLAWGDNSTNQTSIPPGLSNVVAISSGYFHNLALASSFNVNLTNTPPFWLTTNLPPQTLDELTTLLVTNTANDSDLPPQTLTYTVTMLVDTNAMITNGWPLNYATTNPPPVVNSNGVITWTPSEAQGPGVYIITAVVTDNGAPPLSATNSFTVTVNEVNTPPFWPANVPSQTNYIINALSTLTVMNTATDTDIPANPLTYQLISFPAGATIDTDGVITWTPTLAQAGTTNIFTTVVTDTNPPAVNATSLSATNSFTVTVTTLINLTGGQPQTNSVGAGGIIYYVVNVPTNADFATNILLFATNGPVNVWFDTNFPPTTNLLLLPDGTYPSGTNGSVVLSASTTPPLVPGSTYYLGVQNTNSFAVTYAIEVDFHLLTSTNAPAGPIVISSITATNIGGKFGFLLAWYAPTNDEFLVQWTGNLAPPAWNTFSNIVTYTGPPTPTNGLFSFFDDGSQTGGFGPMRFYRLILLQSLTNGAPQTSSVPAGGIDYFLVNVPTNADFATNLLLSATGPVNLLFNPTTPRTGTNAGDYTLLAGATNGISVLSTTSAPTNIVPGGTYWLGVQNTNSFAVSFSIEVDFHLLTSTNVPPPTNTIFITSITATNIGGTNGFLLQWQGPTNFQYEIQWTTNLAPPVWNTVLNPVINVVVTATNGHFSFFDDGTLTGGFGPMKFYRVLGGLNLGPITGSGPATNTVPAGAMSQAVVTVPANAISASNILISATGPLNVWFNQTNPPTGNTNAGDFLMLSATSAGAFVLTSNSVPPLVPGTNYYLGFQNLGATNVTFVFQVIFGYPSVSISSVSVLTNGNFQLQWSAPTNYQFQVAWTTNLMPPMVWNYIPPGPPYITSITTNFTFVDTNAPTAMKFYRLVEYP